MNPLTGNLRVEQTMTVLYGRRRAVFARKSSDVFDIDIRRLGCQPIHLTMPVGLAVSMIMEGLGPFEGVLNLNNNSRSFFEFNIQDGLPHTDVPNNTYIQHPGMILHALPSAGGLDFELKFPFGHESLGFAYQDVSQFVRSLKPGYKIDWNNFGRVHTFCFRLATEKLEPLMRFLVPKLYLDTLEYVDPMDPFSQITKFKQVGDDEYIGVLTPFGILPGFTRAMVDRYNNTYPCRPIEDRHAKCDDIQVEEGRVETEVGCPI